MNILLLSPNTLTTPYPVYPIGLDYVAGSLAPSHTLEILDLNITSVEALEQCLEQFAPQIIGIACRNIDNTDAGSPLYLLEQYQQVIRRIRRSSSAVVVCGGSGFTIMPDKILACLGADYGIVGEGERFGLLVDALAQGHDPSHIPGIITAQTKATMPAPWTGDARRRFPLSAPIARFYTENGGMLNLQSKRGCSFRCLYCPYPSIEGTSHRLFPPDQVAETARELEQAGAQYLFFTDSAFNSDIAHSLAVAEAMQVAGVSIPWGAFFAPIHLPAHYFQTMAAAGCRHVEFGSESLAPTMLKSYRKPFTPEQIGHAHQLALAAGLHVAHYFLLGGPGESEQTVQQTLDGAESLAKAVFFFFIGIRIYPGTGLYQQALEEGKIDPEDDLLRPTFYSPDLIDRDRIAQQVEIHAGKRINWVQGSGGDSVSTVTKMMYRKGYTGPLWEYLIR